MRHIDYENEATDLCRMWGVAPDGYAFEDALDLLYGTDEEQDDFYEYSNDKEVNYNKVADAYERQFGW